MTTATSTTFRVTTTATVFPPDGTCVDAGTMVHDLAHADVEAGKYKLESVPSAAARIARERHMDRLEAGARFDDCTIEVGSAVSP